MPTAKQQSGLRVFIAMPVLCAPPKSTEGTIFTQWVSVSFVFSTSSYSSLHTSVVWCACVCLCLCLGVCLCVCEACKGNSRKGMEMEIQMAEILFLMSKLTNMHSPGKRFVVVLALPPILVLSCLNTTNSCTVRRIQKQLSSQLTYSPLVSISLTFRLIHTVSSIHLIRQVVAISWNDCLSNTQLHTYCVYCV